MDTLTTEVLVVGGGTGGTAAAIQAARRGAQVVLVSEFSWLGGMLTAAGVCAPDGNELLPLQTGLWGAFLRELRRRQTGGLDHAWVSFFTYTPEVGASIFADWVKALPNLHWISGMVPQEVLRQGDRILGVRFDGLTVRARLTLDGTELGDILALGQIPYRWGWEWRSPWQEPSAPPAPTAVTQRYPIQSPTWVVMLRDYGEGAIAPEIPPPPVDTPDQFTGAWEGYDSPEHFLNYGRLPNHRFMLNWPNQGNDYGVNLNRLVGTAAERQQFHQEALWHSWSFARFLQTQLGQRYGLATDTFPTHEPPWKPQPLLAGAFALHPYYRESRRLEGWVTVIEQNILPLPEHPVAPLPTDAAGQVTAIALGNYPNDHHYPGFDFKLQPKAMRWGGRWTGTPFSLPYGCLVPATVEGLLVCEKNISVSHMANGATRLQPVVLGLGQAAGMAAALCIERNCEPRTLPVRSLQEALLHDPVAPAAIAPVLHLSPHHPNWLHQQQHILDHPEDYLTALTTPAVAASPPPLPPVEDSHPPQFFTGTVDLQNDGTVHITLTSPLERQGQTFTLVTLLPEGDRFLRCLQSGAMVSLQGRLNSSGDWLLLEQWHPSALG